jgi:CBS-domain-containing membrane protein
VEGLHKHLGLLQALVVLVAVALGNAEMYLAALLEPPIQAVAGVVIVVEPQIQQDITAVQAS